MMVRCQPWLVMISSHQLKVSVRVIPLMALAEAVAQLQKVNVGLAAPGIAESLNLNNEQLGFAMAIFFLTYFSFQTPMVLLTQRLGPRKAVPLVLVAISIISMSQTVCRSYGTLLFVRALLGVAESPMHPTYKHVLSVFYGKKRLGFANGRLYVRLILNRLGTARWGHRTGSTIFLRLASRAL